MSRTVPAVSSSSSSTASNSPVPPYRHRTPSKGVEQGVSRSCSTPTAAAGAAPKTDAFPSASTAVLPKTDAFACGAASGGRASATSQRSLGRAAKQSIWGHRQEGDTGRGGWRRDIEGGGSRDAEGGTRQETTEERGGRETVEQRGRGRHLRSAGCPACRGFWSTRRYVGSCLAGGGCCGSPGRGAHLSYKRGGGKVDWQGCLREGCGSLLRR